MSLEAPSVYRQLLRAGRAMLSAFTILLQYPVILPVAMITMVNEMNYSGINNITLPAFVGTLNLAENTGKLTGLLVSVFLLSEAIFRLPSGWMSDRFGRSRMITLAMLLLVPSYLIAASLPSHAYLLFIPLRFWDGLMAALMWTSVFAIIGDAVPDRDRANAMGVINMTFMVGAILGYLFAGGAVLFTNHQHPRWYFFFASAVAALVGFAAYTVFKRYPALNAAHPDVHLEDAQRQPVTFARHLPLYVITFLQTFALTLLAPFIFKYATDSTLSGGLALNGRQLLLLLGMPVLGLAIFAIPLSRLADHIGKRNAVRLAFTVVGLTLWIFAVNRHLWVLTVVTTVVGIAFSMGVPAWLAIISALGGRKSRGTTLGGYGTVQGLAAVCGPIVGGFLLDDKGLVQQLRDSIGIAVHGEVSHFSMLFFVSGMTVLLAAILSWLTIPARVCDAENVCESFTAEDAAG